MKKLIFCLVLLSFSNQVLAIECPTLSLSCEHFLVLPNGTQSISQQSAEFVGFNDDEPSLPPNQCNASLTFKMAGSTDTLNVSVYQDLQTYVYVEEGNKTRDPQFSLVIQPHQEFQTYYKSTRLICRLK